MPASGRTASAMSSRTLASTAAGSSSGIIRRSIFSTTRSGTTLVLMPPAIVPTMNVGDSMPVTFERTDSRRSASA